MILKITFLSLLFMSLLNGCSVITTQEKISSEVMPESAAVELFRRVGMPDIRKLFSGGKGPLCGGGLVYDVSIKEVWKIDYIIFKKAVILWSRGNVFKGEECLVGSRFENVHTEEQARELVRAAIALGAKINYLGIRFFQ
jgi:hypothetical protein